MKTYEVRRLNNKQAMADNISDDKIDYYNKALSSFLKPEYGEQKSIEYKEHMKLQAIEVTTNQASK